MKKKHPEHVNHERWLVSYADFITLLFAFFVVLFASGQSDKKKIILLAHSMQSSFRFNGIFSQHAKTPPLSDDAADISVGAPSHFELPVPSAAPEEKMAGAIEKHIEEKFGQEAKAKGQKQLGTAAQTAALATVTVHPAPEGVVISLREAGFFESGSAEVRAESLALVRAVAASLPRQAMRVEGHTDNVPIHTAQFATNWELSTARAAMITRMILEQQAVDPSKISAAGYAEFQPTASNETAEGRAKNRRVDIVLLKPVQAAAK